MLEGDYTAKGVAKALFYPRVLGTSINTSFGTRIQNMFVELDLANGSLIKGMDIEFIDQIDKRKKWCQLKSGPNTINSEDVKPLINKFTKTINLARTNKAFKGINNTDFIVGVLYGEADELSMHYKTIDKTHPVIIGADLWHRITGFPNFYIGLVDELHKSILTIDTKDLINKGHSDLAKEIKDSSLFELDYKLKLSMVHPSQFFLPFLFFLHQDKNYRPYTLFANQEVSHANNLLEELNQELFFLTQGTLFHQILGHLYYIIPLFLMHQIDYTSCASRKY